MAKKIGEEASEELVSVTWKRPGTIEVLVAKVGQESGSVAYSNVFKGLDRMKLIESYTENNSGILSRYSKYRFGHPLFSPTAPNPEAEKESWSADFVLNTRKITLHPNFKKILKDGWGVVVKDEVIWPRMIYKKKEEKGAEFTEGGEDSGEGSDKEPIKNPFYGLQSYFAPAIRVTRERFSDQSGIDGDFLDGISEFDDTATESIPFAMGVRAVKVGHSVSSTRSDRVVRVTWLCDKTIAWPAYEKEVT